MPGFRTSRTSRARLPAAVAGVAIAALPLSARNDDAADAGGGRGHTETSPAVHFGGPSGDESFGAGSNPS